MSAGVIVIVWVSQMRSKKTLSAALMSLNVESEFMKAPLATFTLYFILFWFSFVRDVVQGSSRSLAPTAVRRIRIDKVNLDLPTYSSITCISR